MYKRNTTSLIVLLSLLVLFYFAFLTTYVQSASCGPNGDNSPCLTGSCCSKDGSYACDKDCNPKYRARGEAIITVSATTMVPSPTKLSEA
ncbi:852_t:CDS:2, partial [Racocetra persica]